MFNGNYIIRGKIKCLTGLHIGGSKNSMEIGGSDNVVIRDAINNLPYIPGSSLKGKIRSLLELNDDESLASVEHNEGEPSDTGLVAEVFGKSSTNSSYNINKDSGEKIENKIRELEERIRQLESNKTNENLADDNEISSASDEMVRLIVRDAYPTEDTVRRWENNYDIIDGSELKYENSIDRVKGISNPRNIERVPRESEFEFEIIFGIYNDNEDEEYATKVYHLLKKGLKLLEDNYLGGSGSRGSGRVEIIDEQLFLHDRNYFEDDGEEKTVNWG